MCIKDKALGESAAHTRPRAMERGALRRSQSKPPPPPPPLSPKKRSTRPMCSCHHRHLLFFLKAPWTLPPIFRPRAWTRWRTRSWQPMSFSQSSFRLKRAEARPRERRHFFKYLAWILPGLSPVQTGKPRLRKKGPLALWSTFPEISFSGRTGQPQPKSRVSQPSCQYRTDFRNISS